MTPFNILLTGPTGYIGGSVLSALLRHPRLDEFNITVLVQPEVEPSRFGAVRHVVPVVGSHDDYTLLKSLASQADVVISCADADNLTAAKAILGGLKQRHQDSATVPILIHTIALAVLIDDARGDYVSDRINSDFNLHQLESLPHTQPYREVDTAITDASEEGTICQLVTLNLNIHNCSGYVKTCIIAPGLVYGIARTRLVSLGVQNPRSEQIRAIVDAGIDRRQGGVIGKGLNVWSHVHIEDLVCLYMHIFDAAICSCRLYVGRNGIYFAESGECELGEIFQVVAKELSARGCGTSRPTVFTRAEMEKYTFTRMMGANAHARGERSRSIGWKPVHGMRSMLESIRDEVAASMDAMGANL
ncbi:hypothetical protein JVT61DRAFT_4506 [Boletus reticuloceps]|uniref:Uncharacterized protein n=1 Tax=Boletus reticuloceps TaxID=495285 RepID=A0A8I3A8Y7_9AGAM|nr:hypothetical protein JVT61DRAFT_4506 [Boletus reticuloceps]